MEFWQVSPAFHSIFRHEKKVLALVLAFACAFTMFAGAAFTDQADINADNVEAVDLLTTLGIIKGYEDGSFDPEGTVDRAEMAKMIYTIRNGGNDDASAHVGNTTSFTDISGHWAEGYIKYLQNTGIVAGKSATQFDPDSQVTTGEAMKMALALAGYDEVNAGLTGTAWLNNTVSLATTYGLTDDVASAISGGCSRQDAAQILANALGMTAVRYSSIVENFVNDSENGLSWGGDPISVGRKWMDLWTNIGTLLNIDGKELVLKMSDSDKADSDAKNIDTFINLSKDYSDLLGQKVKVLFDSGKNNSVIGVFAIDDNTVVTANQNAIGVDTGKLKINDVKYTLEDDGVLVYQNGDKQDELYKAGDFTGDQSANVITFIDSDDNDKIDTAYIKTYEVAQVSYVSSSQIIVGGKSYQADEDTIDENLAKDDWAIITHDLYNDNLDIVKAEVETGTVNATRDKGNWTQYEIDNVWYNETNSGDGDVQSNVKAGVDAEYVAVNGILFYAKRITASADHLTGVLFVAYHGVDGLANNQARVMFPDGTEETIDLKNNYVEDQNGAKSTVDPDGSGSTYAAGDIANGAVYEYYRSGSKYQLVVLNTDDEAYGDYTLIKDTGADGVKLNTSGKIASVEGYTIDDGADVVVFAQKNGDSKSYSIKHITGKQLKTLTATNGTTDNNINEAAIAAFESDVNGLTRATALFVKFNSTNGSFNGVLDNMSAYANYGFITDSAKRVGNGQIMFTVWTGTDEVEVYADQTNETKFTKGTVIGYDSITEEDGQNIIDDIFPIPLDDGVTPGVIASSITSARNDGEKFVVDGHEYDVDNFSTVLYVSTSDDDTIGIVDGKATAAHDPLKDGTTLATNILYYGTEVAVIDVNEIAGESYATNQLFDDVDDGSVYVNEIGSFESVQWLNNRTGDTDNDYAYDNAQMTLSFNSTAAGTLTLNGVKGAPLNLTVTTGVNKFENIYVTGDVTATFVADGSTPAPAEGTVLLAGLTNATQAYKANGEITAKLYSEKTSTSLGTATIAITKDGVDAKSNFTVKETVVAAGQGDISITPTDAAMPGEYKVKATFAGVESNELTFTITPIALTGITFDALTLTDLSGTDSNTVADIAIAATGKDYTVKSVEVAETSDADTILASDVALKDSTGYTVKVTVEAKDGYTFPAGVSTWTNSSEVTGLTGATVNAGGVVATSAGSNANSVVVTLTFTSGS